ncbi:MAG: hypothetical protein ACN6O3_01390 [Comamonas sp.]
MNELFAGMVRWTIRLVGLAMGLVFFVSLLMAAALMALLWCGRLLWAKLTGRPVAPFAFRTFPQAGWTTVYRNTARWTAKESGDAPAAARSGMRGATAVMAGDVTDVEARDIR